MKKTALFIMISMIISLTACGTKDKHAEDTSIKDTVADTADKDTAENEEEFSEEIIKIELSNQNILVQGQPISKNEEDSVYCANDIIFYLENQGITYGEGEKRDEHSQIEGDAHTVVHITEPGTYEVTGKMDAGQIFVDLGEDAKNNPEAVVNLILNNADITCTVAPAILFYRVYECGDDEEATATKDVDLSNAGANLVLADESKNYVYGSYVAKIFESCELSQDGMKVIDSKKLHKYDAAVYSKMSMNILGTDGKLNIKAENEGLDTELHLAIEGGSLSIESGNDGINVNEDNVSVFTMNGGNLKVTVSGESGEGDGIDSNGWLIINGGKVNTSSCAFSMDAGIDADCGIYINGGSVIASGTMEAEISGGLQRSVSFAGRKKLEGGKEYQVKDEEGNVVMEVSPSNAYSVLVVSQEGMSEHGMYTLWCGNEQIAEEMRLPEYLDVIQQ